MEECKTNLNYVLFNLGIVIIIIIIIRVLYIRLYNNHIINKNKNNKNINSKIEGFDVINGNAIDLLSKTKSNEVKTVYDATTIINTWTTKFYNIQSPTTRTKQIALYQPILVINNIQYCKLGDMLSQNANYTPPDANQNTLLIKSISDIKPPVRYELIVNFGDEYVNPKYYEYESYITNIDTFNLIKPNLISCSTIINDINDIIINNLTTLRINITDDFKKTTNINNHIYSREIYAMKSDFIPLFKGNDAISTPRTVSLDTIKSSPISVSMTSLTSLKEGDLNYPINIIVVNPYNFRYPGLFAKNIYDFTLGKNIINEIPAGVSGTLNYTYFYVNDVNNVLTIKIDFNCPASLNAATTDAERINIFNAANTAYPFRNIDANNFNNRHSNQKTFHHIPVMRIINYLILFCNKIITIYDKNNLNPAFLSYINLADSKATLMNVLDKIELLKQFLSSYQNQDTITVSNTPNIKTYYDDIMTAGSTVGTTILGKLFTYIKDTKLNYTYTTVNLYTSQLPVLPSNFPALDNIANITYSSITFNNYSVTNILQHVPNSNFDILKDPLGIAIKTNINNLLLFNKTLDDLKTNIINNLPLKIYKPIAPPGYVAVGHVFCNVQSQLQTIKQNAEARTGVCCIPDNCIKEMRAWNISDKVFEYSKDNVYWALYFNKYTGTFISTNTNQLPTEKMCKVIACVTKCTAVEELKKSDTCTRNYYNINKTLSNEAKSSTDLFSDQEEEYYLAKLKTQSDNLTRLSNRAHQMELDIDKANIVNREMNKNKLQSYVDKQKINIDLILQRLIKDKDSIQTNINIPQSILDKLLDMIKNLKDITDEDKLKLIAKLLKNQSCPDPNLSGLVKKQLVSDVCYGCDNV